MSKPAPRKRKKRARYPLQPSRRRFKLGCKEIRERRLARKSEDEAVNTEKIASTT